MYVFQFSPLVKNVGSSKENSKNHTIKVNWFICITNVWWSHLQTRYTNCIFLRGWQEHVLIVFYLTDWSSDGPFGSIDFHFWFVLHTNHPALPACNHLHLILQLRITREGNYVKVVPSHFCANILGVLAPGNFNLAG